MDILYLQQGKGLEKIIYNVLKLYKSEQRSQESQC